MAPLRIQLFGGMRLTRGGSELRAFPTQKSRDLFAFLALNGTRRYSRDVLMGRFCGDSPDPVARKHLRTDLWRIRTVVEEGAARGSCLHVDGDHVAFNRTEGHWIDVDVFERKLDEAGPDRGGALGAEGARALGDAVALYGGDLLDGVYDDWCLFERERLRLRYVTALERLMRHHAGAGDWASAAQHGQRLLACDPLREHVHRDLMRFHARMGDPAAALRQFAACERLLRMELESEPTRETLALRDEIRAGGIRASAPPPPPAPPAPSSFPASPAPTPDLGVSSRNELMERLSTLARILDDTGAQLRRIAEALEHENAVTAG